MLLTWVPPPHFRPRPRYSPGLFLAASRHLPRPAGLRLCAFVVICFPRHERGPSVYLSSAVMSSAQCLAHSRCSLKHADRRHGMHDVGTDYCRGGGPHSEGSFSAQGQPDLSGRKDGAEGSSSKQGKRPNTRVERGETRPQDSEQVSLEGSAQGRDNEKGWCGRAVRGARVSPRSLTFERWRPDEDDLTRGGFGGQLL